MPVKNKKITFKLTTGLSDRIDKFVEESEFFESKSQLIRIAVESYINGDSEDVN